MNNILIVRIYCFHIHIDITKGGVQMQDRIIGGIILIAFSVVLLSQP